MGKFGVVKPPPGANQNEPDRCFEEQKPHPTAAKRLAEQGVAEDRPDLELTQFHPKTNLELSQFSPLKAVFLGFHPLNSPNIPLKSPDNCLDNGEHLKPF